MRNCGTGVSERRRVRRGATLIEAAACLAVIALLAALVATTAAESRRNAQMLGSLGNLRHVGAGTQSYAADHDNRMWGFSWVRGVRYPDFPFAPASTDVQAHADQAVWIMRRQGMPRLGRINFWIPELFYSHLVLSDYLGESEPAKWAVSPADSARIAWQRAITFPCGATPPLPEDCSMESRRWVFSSSYQLPPAFFSPDARVFVDGSNHQTIAQGIYHSTFQANPDVIGTRRLTEVAFPSEKVMLHDSEQRHFGRSLYFALPESRVVLLLSDGSADVRRTADSGRGYLPNNPTSLNPTVFRYTPDTTYEAPTSTGSDSELVYGHYYWTRSGLRGRDFGGPEVPWQEP